MSHVTNIVLAYSCAENELAVARLLNASMAASESFRGYRWFREAECCQRSLLNALAVGDKYPELELHVGAFNRVGDALPALVEAFLAYEWELPAEAILVVAPQEGDWQIYRPNEPTQ